MNIAVQASDLDHARIDGTRVYLRALLAQFGRLAPEHMFRVYHRSRFNQELAPPAFPSYEERVLPPSWAWMQTRFAAEMFRHRPDRLFLPIQAAPVFLPAGLEVIATIHDLAFRRFPETFPRQHLWKLNFMLGTVVRQATRLIAVSESTRRDLLDAYPWLDPARVRVIHHGFDASFFGQRLETNEVASVLGPHGLSVGGYVLYVGALQPRKNLIRLIQAFEEAKHKCQDMKLVLVGEPAWLSEPILDRCRQSSVSADIVLAGRRSFSQVRAFYQGARCFAFPSIYEGFGLPVLEAFASGTPVIAARNSSLPEIAGDAALYCDAHDTSDIARQLRLLWEDVSLAEALSMKGRKRLEHFSWERCARETLDVILDTPLSVE
jgi:glycosyltransferase involved in cell wall biosynthesis